MSAKVELAAAATESIAIKKTIVRSNVFHPNPPWMAILKCQVVCTRRGK